MDKEKIEYFMKFIENGGLLSAVPKEYITKELCELYIKNGGSLKSVPEKYRTQEIYNVHIERGGSIDDVPEKYRTQELYEVDFNREGLLWKVPEEYRTQEMCQKHFDRGGSLSIIPKKYCTRKMYIIHVARRGSIVDVPEEFRTQELYEMYIEKGGTLKDVPEEYRTQELYEIYVEKGGSLKTVPEEYLTQGMCENYFKRLGSLKDIPEEYRTQEMCEDYFKKLGNVFEKYSKKRGSIEDVPEEYRTQEMYMLHIRKGGSIFDVPIEILTKEMLKCAGENNVVLQRVELELCNLSSTQKSKEILAKQYGVSLTYIDNIIEKVRIKRPQLYNEIDKILTNNSYRYKYSCVKKIEKMSIIVDSLGEIEHRKNGSILSIEQKIKLSYLVSKLKISPEKMYKIYESMNSDWIMKDVNLPLEQFKRLKMFFVALFDEAKKIISCSEGEKTEILKKSSLQFLMQYNSDEYFYNNGKPVVNSVLDLQNNVITITEENSKPVLEILESNNIPLSNVIVRESFRIYFREGMEGLNNFINKLHSYDVMVQEMQGSIGNLDLQIEEDTYKAMVVSLPVMDETENNLIEKNSGYGIKR